MKVRSEFEITQYVNIVDLLLHRQCIGGGDAVRLFDLPASRSPTGIGVTSGSERFLFLVDPGADQQSLSVLVNWPAGLEKP